MGAVARVSLIAGLESSLGGVILAALGSGVGGTASGDLTFSTLGTFTSSTGTWTGVEGMARIISDAAGIVAMWTSTEAAMQEYKIRSSIADG
jgi:hypothetical protein